MGPIDQRLRCLRSKASRVHEYRRKINRGMNYFPKEKLDTGPMMMSATGARPRRPSHRVVLGQSSPFYDVGSLPRMVTTPGVWPHHREASSEDTLVGRPPAARCELAGVANRGSARHKQQRPKGNSAQPSSVDSSRTRKV